MQNRALGTHEQKACCLSKAYVKVVPVSYDVIVWIMNFVTVTNYHFYHLFLLQIQQIKRMSLFMKFEPLFLHLLKIFYEKLCMKLLSIKNKSCKVLILSFILIASITNYMNAKFYEVWTIIFKVIAISGYSGVYCRLKYLHAVVTFYTYLLGISSAEMVIMSWNVDIMFLQYLYKCNCNNYGRLFVLYSYL